MRPTVERGGVMSRFGGFNGHLDSGSQYAKACCARPLAKLLSLLRSALVGGAVLGLIQPAFAVGVVSPDKPIFPTSGHGIYAALLNLDGGKAAPAGRDDEVFSALSGFAKAVSAETSTSGAKITASRQTDDAIYAELNEFAGRVGAKRPVAREARVQLAEADNAVDAMKEFLRGNGSPAPVAPAPARSRPAGSW